MGADLLAIAIGVAAFAAVFALVEALDRVTGAELRGERS